MPRKSIHESSPNFPPLSAGNGEPLPRSWRRAVNTAVAADMGVWAICSYRLLIFSGHMWAWTLIDHFHLTTDCYRARPILWLDGSRLIIFTTWVFDALRSEAQFLSEFSSSMPGAVFEFWIAFSYRWYIHLSPIEREKWQRNLNRKSVTQKNYQL